VWQLIKPYAEAAGVPGIAPHDLGVPESTMLAIMGHMSRAMLERHSHIRMAAKRVAVEALSLPDLSAVTPVQNAVAKVSAKVAGEGRIH
jgi:hypothetical protein